MKLVSPRHLVPEFFCEVRGTRTILLVNMTNGEKHGLLGTVWLGFGGEGRAVVKMLEGSACSVLVFSTHPNCSVSPVYKMEMP